VSFLALPACGPEKEPSPIIRAAIPETNTFDPACNIVPGAATLSVHLFEGLLTIGPSLDVRLGMAESYDISNDGLIYTFHMRQARWSDGRPVTADDFVYAVRRVVDPAQSNQNAAVASLIKNAAAVRSGAMTVNSLGVRAVDERTIEFTLERPSSYFLELLAIPAFFPVREDVVLADRDGWAAPGAKFPTNGAYRVKGWNGDAVTLVKNNDYWNRDEVLPDTIEFELMAGANSMLAAFNEGLVYFADACPRTAVTEKAADDQLGTSYFLDVGILIFNPCREALSDTRLRSALALAINRAEAASIAGFGFTPAGGIVPPGLPDVGAGSDFRRTGGNFYHADNHESDFANAHAIIDAILEEKGELPIINILAPDHGTWPEQAAYIASVWTSELGLEVRISVQYQRAYIASREQFMYDVCLASYAGLCSDPSSFLQRWTSGSPNNFSPFRNDQYDQLILQAADTGERRASYTALHQAERLIASQEACIIPLNYSVDYYLVSPRLKGVYNHPLGYTYFTMAYLEADEDSGDS